MSSNTEAIRAPAEVMRLTRLGAFHQTRLSFVRSLVRTMITQRWKVVLHRNALDANGYGHLVYRVTANDRIYDFVALSTPLSADHRSDRVIAERWDSSFALIDGEASDQLIAHLLANAPLQEQGRMKPPVLVMSRANRSVRLFDYVVDQLAKGLQPDSGPLKKTGYLMRTTAVYANGKFGLGDYGRMNDDDVMKASFRAQMLAVYLVRLFSFDLINHIARRRKPESAVALGVEFCRYLGIGNATGLGMAPFLISHPALINQWIHQRERAVARVRSVHTLSTDKIHRFRDLCQRAYSHYSEFRTDDVTQQARYDLLLMELKDLIANHLPQCLSSPEPWARLTEWCAANASVETQELINSIIIEMHPELVDELAEFMDANEPLELDSHTTIGDLLAAIQTQYNWALALDFDSPDAQQAFWYRSEEKQEPRLGQRFREPGAELEMDIGVARDVSDLYHTLSGEIQTDSSLTASSLIGEYILRNPASRGLIRRIQNAARIPYGEIQDNLLASDCRPIDLLRCKLSFFGASSFDPKSNLWTRITLFQGAPLPDQLLNEDADDWLFPVCGVVQ